jgi:hypothetical protein
MMFALAFTLAGCATPDHLKPPKQPDSFAPPPFDSVARFSEPPEPPKKYLMEDLPSKLGDPNGTEAQLRRTGGPAGMAGGPATRGF